MTEHSVIGLRKLSEQLQRGELTSVALVKTSLAKAQASESVFIRINSDLLSLAEVIDSNRHKNTPPLAGIPITLKDLFNVRNETTLAGSIALKHNARAEAQDAEVVAPLRDAGLLFLGRTNMSEFAFSGMGKNPHYGTPLSIWDRDTGRLPGGSSSGSAVSVAEGIVAATLGSDTAGSCRIPAAFNGIVGVKPSFGRMSLNGIYPLSPTSDAPGPLAVDVDSCFILDQLMSGQHKPGLALPSIKPRAVDSLRLVIPDGQVMADLDAEVKSDFYRSIEQLADAGANIETVAMPVLDDCIDMFANRAIALYEAYQHHQHLLEKYLDEYDPFVGHRINTGSALSEAEQQERYREKATLIEQFNRQFAKLEADAILYPTVACVPPAISSTDDLEQSRKVNLRCLRNTATANYFDGCSISLPCHRPGNAPVGLMLSAVNGMDESLYRSAAAVESVLAG
ncbi:MAG: aspartyl-tRNA(Asn)/glutamyl-tRNA(Gln) amidotransferase subunit A [Planctomycetota bacterium]|jgi:aspartyl-tRNA(Asn)/glutamyl-tRNA(Gln) amidotransferase subunit A